MTVKIEGDTLIFDSGKKRHANCGIVGISGDSFDVSEGYDGGLWRDGDDDSDYHDDPLTPEDLAELAEFMIARWTAFKEHSQRR